MVWAAATAWLLFDGRRTIGAYLSETLSARLAAEVPAPSAALTASMYTLLWRLSAGTVALLLALAAVELTARGRLKYVRADR